MELIIENIPNIDKPTIVAPAIDAKIVAEVIIPITKFITIKNNYQAFYLGNQYPYRTSDVSAWISLF